MLLAQGDENCNVFDLRHMLPFFSLFQHAICLEQFTHYIDMVPDDRDPKGSEVGINYFINLLTSSAFPEN